jgi:hypothetical protein
MRDKEAFEALVRAQRAIRQQLEADLDAFISKSD